MKGLRTGKNGSAMSRIKNSPEDQIIEEQIQRFIHLLGIDPNIKEVNFYLNEIKYVVDGYLVSITFKSKKEYGTKRNN